MLTPLLVGTRVISSRGEHGIVVKRIKVRTSWYVTVRLDDNTQIGPMSELVFRLEKRKSRVEGGFNPIPNYPRRRYHRN
jgi:hypothetical protein